MSSPSEVETASFDVAHGTCASRAEQIKREGFKKPTMPSMRGTGVYFWIGEYRVTLAKEWHNKKLQDHEYSRDTSKSCAVIVAKIEFRQDGFLNLSDPDVIITLEEMTKGRKALTHDRMAKVYDQLVERLEKQLGPIEIVFDKVPAPDPQNTAYPSHLKWPMCAVVRHLTCIKNVDVLSA